VVNVVYLCEITLDRGYSIVHASTFASIVAELDEQTDLLICEI